jgi:hypothetical protein
MLDFLESDWEVCVRQSKDQANTEAVLKESLIWYYVVGDNQSVSRIARRRIAKAVFAMATSESLRDYPEVWEKETVELKSRGSKRQKLDDVSFEEGGVGDYDSDEDMLESDEVEDDQETRSAGLPGCNDIGGATEQLGGSASIELRQRLLVLVRRILLHYASVLIKTSYHKSPQLSLPNLQHSVTGLTMFWKTSNSSRYGNSRYCSQQ